MLLFLYVFCFHLYFGGFILFCSVCVCVCVWVGFVMCVFVRVLQWVGVFGNMHTVLWLRFFLTWLRFSLPWLRFSHVFSSVYDKCQSKTRKDGARPALFHISCYFVSFGCYFVLFGCYLCCSMYCLCVNVYCHRVTTQLQLINISYILIWHPVDGRRSDRNKLVYINKW